jgi:hypothetical protein
MKVAKVGIALSNQFADVGGDENYRINLANLDLTTHVPPVNQSVIDLCYNVYPDQKRFETALLKNDNIWVIYKFSPLEYGNVHANRKSYESFVCGFLQYYDREVRNGMIDHTIYFHWGKWGSDPNCVVIFIDDPPRRYPTNNRLSNQIERKYPANYYDNTSEVQPPITQSKVTDPPKPPGPPPPY